MCVCVMKEPPSPGLISFLWASWAMNEDALSLLRLQEVGGDGRLGGFQLTGNPQQATVLWPTQSRGLQ